ncbi:hypothetical protein ACFSKL_03220 [Belliella marina]|uniref:Uncharacterized protein n=1 Tax=Belliella marina TaxID=1644146 RepID=A0ABW4VGH8_9BACT
MDDAKDIDIELIENTGLFQKIQAQKTLFINLFSEISNHIPQSLLLHIHYNAKGNKVSQGANLKNCPYQVLDIIRDFDQNTGHNIRILNWWGHGLYIIHQYGKLNLQENWNSIKVKYMNHYVGLSQDPYNYGEILNSETKLEVLDLELHSHEFRQLILFDKIPYTRSIEEQKEILLKKIKFILDK